MSLTAAFLLAGCADAGSKGGPPLTQLYFPAGLQHVKVAGKAEGVLFVSNANFDKRYATGSINALALDSLGLPVLGSMEAQSTVKALKNLKIAETQSVQIASFSGEMAVEEVSPAKYRLYVPTRSEGMRVYRVGANVDADGMPTLTCVGGDGQNCTELGLSLSSRETEQSTTGVPRAPSPYGVALGKRTCTSATECCGADEPDCGRSCVSGACVGKDMLPYSDVWVTHITQADSPNLSNAAFRGYAVRLDSDDFVAAERNFINIGAGGSNSVIVHKNWSYVTGRILSPAPNLLRVVNRSGVTLVTSLESLFRVSDARGLAVSSDGTRLFVVGRIPDTLMVLGISNADSAPGLSFIRSIPLPEAPNEIRVISRAGKGDLAVISCTTAGSLTVYDDDVGNLVSTVQGIGVQPYSVAVDQRGQSARIFVSLFGDGRIAVIDLDDVNRPQLTHLVAHLGEQQLCLTRGVTSPGCVASKGADQ